MNSLDPLVAVLGMTVRTVSLRLRFRYVSAESPAGVVPDLEWPHELVRRNVERTHLTCRGWFEDAASSLDLDSLPLVELSHEFAGRSESPLRARSNSRSPPKPSQHPAPDQEERAAPAEPLGLALSLLGNCRAPTTLTEAGRRPAVVLGSCSYASGVRCGWLDQSKRVTALAVLPGSSTEREQLSYSRLQYS